MTAAPSVCDTGVLFNCVNRKSVESKLTLSCLSAGRLVNPVSLDVYFKLQLGFEGPGSCWKLAVSVATSQVSERGECQEVVTSDRSLARIKSSAIPSLMPLLYSSVARWTFHS